MKPQLSLKWFVTLSFLSIAVILVIGYSLLSARFFLLGMDNIIASNMAQVVESYVNTVPEAERQSVVHFSGYRIAGDWQQMPAKVRQAFKEPGEEDVLFKYDESGWFTPPDEVLFFMRVSHGGHSYFISQSVTRETASALVGRNAAQNMRFLLTLSFATVLTLAMIIFLVLRRVERPVKGLGRWARSLNETNLHEEPPDFSYPELNELATLIRTSLSSVQESLEREHRFLRHSSHELRTPISVIRNNVELLHKLQERGGADKDARKQQILDRIDRASLTMKYLTETLLWLSRESEEKLPEKTLDLEALIRELVAESDYLLKDKEVETVVETTPCEIRASEAAARIVLGNLIRNAFQHTWHGTVRICQSGGEVEIINDMVDGDDPGRDLGFGLGLRLTEQLTCKLDWPYSSRLEEDKHRARVCIG